MVCAGRHCTTHSSIGCNGMAAINRNIDLRLLTIQRAYAELELLFNRDPNKQAELEATLQRLQEEETTLKVSIRLDQANKS